MDIILTQPVQFAYIHEDKFWYVVQLNKGYYIHYTWNWGNTDNTITYTILPQMFAANLR